MGEWLILCKRKAVDQIQGIKADKLMLRSLLGFLVIVMSPLMLWCGGIPKKGIRKKAHICYAAFWLVTYLFLL